MGLVFTRRVNTELTILVKRTEEPRGSCPRRASQAGQRQRAGCAGPP
jgi:hypothetical protein